MSLPPAAASQATPTPSGSGDRVGGGLGEDGEDGEAEDGTDDVAGDQPGSGSDDDDMVLHDARRVTDDTAELDVEDQRGDGRAVRIDEVRLATGEGMVGIYDAGLTLLGWAPVESGVEPVTVELDHRVGSSQELLAVLHLDDGDGRLDSGDAVVVEEGEQVSEDFDYLLG